MPRKPLRVQFGEFKNPLEVDESSAQARYHRLATIREPFLKRAEKLAQLTIPSLMPPRALSDGADLYIPYQVVGGEGIKNLSAKLMLALFPPGHPFFRLTPNQFDLRDFENQQQADDIRGRIEKKLGQIERDIAAELEIMSTRTTFAEVAKQLLVAGNCLTYFFGNLKGTRLFRLNEYVCTRDNEGNLLEVILEENLSYLTLPAAIRFFIDSNPQMREKLAKATSDNASDLKNIQVYTRIWRDGKRWRVIQEVGGITVPQTQRSYAMEGKGRRLPWIVSRLVRVDGEDYGRGMEEAIGGLWSLESLEQSIVDFGASASKIIPMVNPNGVTDPNVLEQDSGTVVEGDPDDVRFVSMDKFADMRFVRESAQELSKRLDAMFLKNSTVQRDAERVTAEEVRLLAGDIDDGLGGVFTVLSDELQRPVVEIMLSWLSAMQRIAPIDTEEDVRPQITTGLEALGRNRDRQNLEAFVLGLSQLYGPDEVAKVMPLQRLAPRLATSYGIDLEGLVRTEEEIQQIDQQAQAQALAEKVAPNAAAAAGQQLAEQPQPNQQQVPEGG